jgi:hypothetical protein
LASIVLPAALFLVLRKRHVPAFVSPLSFVVSALIFYFADHVTKHTLGTLAVALSICTLDATYEGIRRVLSAKPFVAIGAISYSLYLWQQPFWKAAAQGPAWMSAVALALAFVVVEPTLPEIRYHALAHRRAGFLAGLLRRAGWHEPPRGKLRLTQLWKGNGWLTPCALQCDGSNGNLAACCKSNVGRSSRQVRSPTLQLSPGAWLLPPARQLPPLSNSA